jgi:heptaprenyl diphosphate synthase
VLHGPAVKSDFQAQVSSVINRQGERIIGLLKKMEPAGGPRAKEAHPLTHSEQTLKALLIVFPNIEEQTLTVLDECQQMIRPKIINLGLMIGQFHPKCRERAIHNPQQRNAISRSSVPLMAMRHMVMHDIMFLQDNKEAFRVYDSKFGFRFAKRATSLPPYQKHLSAYYERAKSNYSDTENGYPQG